MTPCTQHLNTSIAFPPGEKAHLGRPLTPFPFLVRLPERPLDRAPVWVKEQPGRGSHLPALPLPLAREHCPLSCPHSIAKVNRDLSVAKCSSYFLVLFSLDLLGAPGSVDPLLPSGSSSNLCDAILRVFLLPPRLLLLCSFKLSSVCSPLRPRTLSAALGTHDTLLG